MFGLFRDFFSGMFAVLLGFGEVLEGPGTISDDFGRFGNILKLLDFGILLLRIICLFWAHYGPGTMVQGPWSMVDAIRRSCEQPQDCGKTSVRELEAGAVTVTEVDPFVVTVIAMLSRDVFVYSE